MQIVTKHCTKKYSISCLKLEAVRLVDRLSLTPAYRLLPGVSLVHTNYTLVGNTSYNLCLKLIAYHINKSLYCIFDLRFSQVCNINYKVLRYALNVEREEGRKRRREVWEGGRVRGWQYFNKLTMLPLKIVLSTPKIGQRIHF